MKAFIICIAAALTTSLSVDAQSNTAGGLARTQVDLDLFQNQGLVLNDNRYEGYQGSPYAEEELTQSVLNLDGGNKQMFFVRYNVLEDRMEFSPDNNKTNLKQLPKNSDIVVSIGDKNYQYLSVDADGQKVSGYFEILKTFDRESLLVIKHKKSVMDKDAAQSSSYVVNSRPKIKDSNTLYFVEGQKAMKISNSKRKFLKALPSNKSKQVKSYIKENNIRFEDDYRGLTAALKYYKSI